MEQRGERFWELDSVRGIAIVSMIAVHAVYDMIYLKAIAGQMGYGFWGALAFVTASTFVMVVGISFWISYSRTIGNKGSFLSAYPKYIRRGLFILSGGMLITAVTFVLVPEGFVVFGILHLIGVSVIIAPLFYRFGENNVYIGMAFIAAGILISGVTGPYFLLPLGIHPADFFSFDYEPVFPWFGMVLVGMYIGSILYPGGKRAFSVRESPGIAGAFLAFLGRNSLLIYFLHQPVLIFAITYLF